MRLLKLHTIDLRRHLHHLCVCVGLGLRIGGTDATQAPELLVADKFGIDVGILREVAVFESST